MTSEARHERRRYLLVWGALLGLLAVTVGSAFVPMGVGNVVANLGVALLKALLVMTYFMHLLRAGGLVRLVALIGFLWLSLLIGLTAADVLTRAIPQVPW